MTDAEQYICDRLVNIEAILRVIGRFGAIHDRDAFLQAIHDAREDIPQVPHPDDDRNRHRDVL